MRDDQNANSDQDDPLIRSLTMLQRQLSAAIATITEHQRIQHLLQGVAHVSHTLLVEQETHTAIAKALQALGQATQADSIAVFAHNYDPTTQISVLTLHTVWDRLPAQTESKAKVVQHLATDQWVSDLNQGNPIRLSIDMQSEQVRELFARWDVQSLLIMPIPCYVGYWGGLVFVSGATAISWTLSEEAIFMTIAAALGGAVAQQHGAQREAQLQQDLNKAQHLESLGLLARGVAHDFNNILQVIIGQLELLRQHPGAAWEVLDDIELAQKAAERAAQLVQQLRTQAGQEPQHRETLTLTTLVQDTLQFVRSIISSTIRLHMDIDPETLAIIGDPIQIQQVLLNLLMNAGEAIEEQSGTITVTARPLLNAEQVIALNAPAPYVEITIRDTGSGIDEVTRTRIFEPYFSTKANGRGLGLSTVLGIVRAHKGDIMVESVPGEGTTFRVVLPMATGQ